MVIAISIVFICSGEYKPVVIHFINTTGQFIFLPMEKGLLFRYHGQEFLISLIMSLSSRNCYFRRANVNKICSCTTNSTGTRPIITKSIFQESPYRSSRLFQLILKRFAVLVLKFILFYSGAFKDALKDREVVLRSPLNRQNPRFLIRQRI